MKVGKIKPNKGKIVNEKTLLATVDISQVKHMGYARCLARKELKPFEFFNNVMGFNKFWERIMQFKKANHLSEIVVGVESTGSYGEPFIHYLKKRGVKIVQVNPMHTKRLKELNGNSPEKTDKKDPKVIADIIELGHCLTVIIPEGTAAELRRLTHARERAMQRRTALFNQTHSLMAIIFPEFLQVMKNIKTKSSHHLLRHYPTPLDIVKCGHHPLFLILKKISRGKLDKERADMLFKVAKRSVGVTDGKASIVREIKAILTQIEGEIIFIDEVEREMVFNLEQISYSRNILSLKGIGTITAAGIIGEVADFNKFRTISEIEKLAGLDLYEISSGKHKGKRRISKRGRSLLRKLLFFASINMVRSEGIMHERYQKMIQREMIKKKALVAISRDILALIFALVRDNSLYIKNYNQIHNHQYKIAA